MHYLDIFLTSVCVNFSMYRKSSGHKVLAVGAAEGPRVGLSGPSERLPEHIEALIPMISSHYIDTKVR